MLVSILQRCVLFAMLGALGACGADPSSWAGKTYLLEIPPAHWSDPPNIGGDIGEFVPQFLIGLDKSLAPTVSTAMAGVQDPCNPTTTATSTGSYPSSHIVASEFPTRLTDPTTAVVVNTTIHDLTLVDVLPGDAPAKFGEFTATIDIAEVYSLFRLIPNATKESVCAQLMSFGAPCAVCAFNQQPYCLTITAVQLGATAASTPLTPISTANIPASCTQ